MVVCILFIQAKGFFRRVYIASERRHHLSCPAFDCCPALLHESVPSFESQQKTRSNSARVNKRTSQNDNTRSQVNKNFISNRAGICHLLDSGYDNRFGGHGSWWLGPSTWGLFVVFDLRSRKFLYKSPGVWHYEQSIP